MNGSFMGLCLRVVRVPPHFCFPVNRVWMESYGYYLAKKNVRMLVTFPMSSNHRVQHLDEQSKAYG